MHVEALEVLLCNQNIDLFLNRIARPLFHPPDTYMVQRLCYNDIYDLLLSSLLNLFVENYFSYDIMGV